MARVWNVKVDERMYAVQLKGRKVGVNGEKLKLNKYRKKTGLVHEEYEFPVGSKNALLVLKNMSAPQLVIDGIDCATGEKYVPFKMPWWSYIFIVLHLINFMNGAIGALAAIVGVGAATAISNNSRMNIVVRLLLNIVLLVLLYGMVIGLAIAIRGAIY